MALKLIQHEHPSLYICFALNTQVGTKTDDDTLKEVLVADTESNMANRRRRTNAKTPTRSTRQTTSWKQWQRDTDLWDASRKKQ
jgi:hypothetical protein